MRKMKALSLLELVVVMAISAGLLIIGIIALINYRSSVQLQSAYTDIVSSIKTFQNKSNNSTSIEVNGNRVSPDFYAFKFDPNVLSIYYCITSGSGTLVHCEPYPIYDVNNLKDTYNVTLSSNCTATAFTRLTTDIVSLTVSAFSGNGSYSTTGNSCILTLSHTISGDSRRIEFNLNENKIDL